MEDNQVAAPQGTEATPTNSNEQAPQTQAPATAQETTQAPQAPTADIPADKIEAFNKFVNANGGFDKAFAKLRNDVSTPAPTQPQEPAQPAQPVQPAQPQAPLQPPTPPSGYETLEELAIENYFDRLAGKKEYEPIADQIRNGDVFKEMAKFGIQVSQNGAINSKQIKDFLDMYAKTVPAPAPSTPITTTPTANYVQVGEQITSRDEAMKIIQQNMELRGKGIAEHPQTAAAKEYLKKYFSK